MLHRIMTNAAATCHKCGAEMRVTPGQKILRRDACPQCGADLHCCYNCQFYDPGKHNQCAETQAEYVQYKEEANFCDHFQPGAPSGRPGRTAGPRGDEARRKFDSLFKT
jgi:hypothetical protein